jgi:hypothetical protein
MTVKPIRLACVLMLALFAAAVARGQEAGKTKDAELDSLLENLKDRDEGTGSAPKKKAKSVEAAQSKSLSGEPGAAKKSASVATSKPSTAKSAAGSAGQNKPTSGSRAQSKPAPKSPKAETLAPTDQAIDDLLGKLGESQDEPSRDDRPRNPASGAGQPPDERKPGVKEGPKLGGKDKEIDDTLEELAGRRRKRPQADDGERSGPIGEMIKEMRDVEHRLGKPDTSEDTQAKQKQIIKRIDTLIEQVRQSGGSGGGLTIRVRRQRSNQPGEQQGDQPGAMAQGAGPMKAGKPTTQHSTAGGKGTWGHLPAELRQVMENTFKEEMLGSKQELISRYFLSVGKGKLVREE